MQSALSAAARVPILATSVLVALALRASAGPPDFPVERLRRWQAPDPVLQIRDRLLQEALRESLSEGRRDRLWFDGQQWELMDPKSEQSKRDAYRLPAGLLPLCPDHPYHGGR